MAKKKYKLFFSLDEGEFDKTQIINFFKSKNINARNASIYKDNKSGAIDFQKENDKQMAWGQGSFSIENSSYTLFLGDPRHEQPQQKQKENTEDTVQKEELSPRKVVPEFFNPYHFIDVKGYTPKYDYTPHDSFSGHTGKITVEAEFNTPFFIPDPDKTTYVISDETVVQEDENKTSIIHNILSNFNNSDKVFFNSNIRDWDEGNDIGKYVVKCNKKPGKDWELGTIRKHGNTYCIISDDTVIQEDENKTSVIQNILSNFNNSDKVFFNSNIRDWNEGNDIGKYVVKRKEKPGKDWEAGIIKKEGGTCYIEAENLEKANRWAHKEMEFFKVNGEYLILGSTFRGMLRSTVETLSNSCFPGYDNQDNDSGDMFYRLDIDNDSKESTNLKPVVLKRVDDSWGYVLLDEAKVLSPHIYNRIKTQSEIDRSRTGGETALGAFWNDADNFYEKISIIGKSEYNKESGLHKYKKATKGKGEIKPISSINAENFSINKINGDKLDHQKNKYDKPFPFIKDIPPAPRLWAIIRKKNKFDQKIKIISTDLKMLKDKLDAYKKLEKKVKYAICEIRIKTSFDIDTKTQHKAFFIFGKDNFEQAVNQSVKNKKINRLSEKEIDQFKSLLKQRKENADKVQKDKQGINLKLAKEMPDDIYDGMLAFYSAGAHSYLTYTKVPQKPYKKSIRNLLDDQKKLACNKLKELCPACNMFGTVNLDMDEVEKVNALKGKISVCNGEPVTTPKPHGKVTLKALGSPKPTYYPFYVINNREKQNTKSYDNENISIGRKVYLHHKPEKLDFQDNRKTNLNSTISPLPAGTKFSFEINFTNLSNYELGLLLCSLDMRYKGEKVGYHLGMGKSLGLGSCMISLKKVSLLDIPAYYNAFTGKSEIDISSERKDKFISAYQYVQSSENKFTERKAETDKLNLLNGDNPPVSRDNTDYFSLNYIKEFHILKALNIHSDKTLSLPIVFAGNTEKGFEWYQKARKDKQQYLFHPEELEKNMSRDKEYSLKASL